MPLGGRHVQHFWRLLNGLSIPHATLLDLDLGRHGGGFGRVKTIVKKLLRAGWPREKVLAVEGGELSQEHLDKMHEWDSSDSKHLCGWTDDLRNYGVFFSDPLDLDMTMLAAFPEAYEAIIPKGGGPTLEPDEAVKIVLGSEGNGIADYKGDLATYKDKMPAYCYHFQTHSKPASHLQALAQLEDKRIAKGLPETYKKLIKHINANLKRD
jgi:putative ATP-dependent endonuclease of OLD family